MDQDVIIIGGGAAGLSAALWCDELNLKALLCESETQFGGQLRRVYNPIKNHLGIETENGLELRDIFLKQIEKRKFSRRLRSEIARVDLENKSVTLASGEIFFAAALIIATGVRRRRLNIRGEKEFERRGIIDSGKRDAPLAAGKNVCIIGGGDAALENALILAETAASVTVVHRRPEFRARPEFIEQVKNNSKIELLTGTVAREIMGNQSVESVKLENPQSGKSFEKSAEIVLIRIGVEPNTDFLNGIIDLDEHGYIKISRDCETNIERVYAVGDAANPHAPTVSSAIGMGATAAKHVFFQLNQ